MSSLTDEQKRRIEESKRKALALRAAKHQPQSNNAPKTHSSLVNRTFSTNFAVEKHSGNFSSPSGSCSGSGFYSKKVTNPRIQTQSQPFSAKDVSRNISGYEQITQRATTGISQSTTVSRSTPVKHNSYTNCHKSLQSVPRAADKSVQARVTADMSPAKSSLSTVRGTCVLMCSDKFNVDVGYSAALIEIFKSMTTKQYDPSTKKWGFHLSEYSKLMQHIRGLGSNFNIEPLSRSVQSAFSAAILGKVKDTSHVTDVDLSVVDHKLVNTLMPFQRDGVNFAIHRQGRVLIADDMGLGKTLQAMCVVSYYRSEWPLLIVVPSSVRFAWREQILEWLPSVDAQQINVVVTGKESSTSGQVNIISYDLMVKRKKELQQANFRVVIMDESHSLKNVKTARTQAAVPVLKKAKRVILLSGTPALSRPSELFTQISAIDHAIFPNFHEFGVRYCDGKKHAWGWDFSGSSNLAELQLILEEKIMIRRLKSDVLSQLPSKCRHMVILDPGSVKINKCMQNSHKLVDKMKGMERRGALLEYFQETGRLKAAAVREYVLDLLEADRKLLVFAHHQLVLDVLEEMVTKKNYGYIRIDGRTSSEQRTYFVNKFQSDERVKIALLSITAASVGINLTAASLVVFAELFWNPGILMQAEDRAHRIGQADNVTVHYLVAKGTADDYVWPLVQQKLQVLGQAGLSKDDFSHTDTTVMKDPKQREILSYFEQSFIEELDVEMTEEQSHINIASNSIDSSKTQPEQSNLFNYFKPSSKSTVFNNNNETMSEQNHEHKIETKVLNCDKASDGSTSCGSTSNKQDNTCLTNEIQAKCSSNEISGDNCKEDADWLDHLEDEFWEDELDPDAPWPPPSKKPKVCS